jgi:hypothetical protein
MLFGDVGEVQEVRERPRDLDGAGQPELAQQVGKTIERLLAGLVRRFCDGPHLFHAVEERVALAQAQDVAQQLAQQADIVSKWFVGVD